MTLSHDLGLAASGGASDHRNERVARGVGVALGKCLCQALESGRLKSGILQSASLLQSCPERVLLCLLPVTQNNVCDHALHIHHTLITAFCIEHGIRFLRVNGEDLARAVIRLTDAPSDCPDTGCVRHRASVLCAAPKSDVSCVLIKSPKDGGVSFEDEVVLDYYDEMVKSLVYPKPVLNIPG
ncbi:growth arrest and DNA damage-inducible protein GADD45 alpha-like [Littorina saxatilis]|uniref:Ribosomal protein L7Ae/L30e/S12e/Gadd45 domain-containing protein n=1 Tax=Littorina saxatilis TaxID=31220 RepID=A0AAN9B6P6_9CAEN